MRNLMLIGNGCLGAVCIFVAIGFSIYFGVQSGSWMVFVVSLVGLLFGVVFFFRKAEKHLETANLVDMSRWQSTVAHCQYRYGWDGFGIALDTSRQVIHLMGQTDQKVLKQGQYSFSDVREWGFDIPGVDRVIPGQVVGGGLQGAGANIGNAVGSGAVNMANYFSAANRTGLWFRVRDLQNPKWFVRFPRQGGKDNDGEHNLNRWMEILQQCINESSAQPSAPPSVDVAPERFCSHCGGQLKSGANFCIGCGSMAKS